MLIWALFAGLTAVAVVIVLAPLARARGEAAGEDGDLSVYRDQLAEVDRDREAGLVGEPEAEAARAEISRRLLRAARRGGGEKGAVVPFLRARVVAVLVLVLVPAFTVGGYLLVGRPDLPDAPLAERLAGASRDQSIETLVARVEAHLAQNQNDARGWEVIAPVYMRIGRMADAARAWRTAMRIAGVSERRQIGLGEALVAGADGKIDAEAQDAFREALKIEPTSVLPRMYLAAALAQEGRTAEAVDAWKAIVASGTEADPWMPVAREELAKAEAVASGKPLPAPAEAAAPNAGAPGPTAADVQAAGQMSQGDRAQMIAGMVARLDERLKASGGTVDEWERLVRAYRVMGRSTDADAAIGRARAALSADPAALARLDALAAEAGAPAGAAPASAAPMVAPPAPGPTSADVEAAGQMSQGDRAKMISDMVGRLDERLKTSGGTIAEWERLIRAYRVMGRAADADAAIGRARTALAADPAALARLDALAAEK